MKRKILIVDDDREFGLELTEALSYDYSAVHVYDGKTALARLREERFDLYLLDYRLAGLNGAEIAKRIKEIDPESKIILLSGKPLIKKALKEEDLLSLFEAVIEKPFNPVLLFEKIDSLFSE
jgi:DNA-binding response OmpR family regulator